LIKAGKSLVKGHDFGNLFFRGQIEDVNQDPPMAPPAFSLASGACVIDQNSAHCLSRGDEKLASTGPLDLPAGLEPNVSLVNQTRGLQGVIDAFFGHAASRQASQLFVNDWKQFAVGLVAWGSFRRCRGRRLGGGNILRFGQHKYISRTKRQRD